MKPPLSSFAAPPRFRESSERLSVRKGDRAVLECAPSAGDRPMDLFWRRNGIDVMRGEDAREVFNSPVSLLNLCFCVAIYRNCLNTQKNVPFHLNLLSIFNFEVFQLGFKWE